MGDFNKTEFIEAKEYIDREKIDLKVFKNDPEDCKLNFVRIYHDFKWQLGAIMKGLKSKKAYDIILLDFETDESDDPVWQIHNIDKSNYSRSYEIGQELISKIRTYSLKEDTGDWLVTCKINPPSRVKTLGYVSMILKEKSIPVKMEFLDIT